MTTPVRSPLILSMDPMDFIFNLGKLTSATSWRNSESSVPDVDFKGIFTFRHVDGNGRK